MLLTLTPATSGAASLTLINDGAATGYELLQGASFGSPVWDHTYSGPRGTQGARPSQGRLPNRVVSLPLRVAGASKDAMAASVSDLADVVDDVRRFGGTCRMRSKAQTRAQNFDVLTATIDLPEWNNRLELRDRAVVVVTLTCGPYVLGDPMDFTDTFTVDNVNGGALSYVADAGALTNVAVAGGVLDAAANFATETRVIYTGDGYTYGDHEATVQVTPGSTITGFKAGVVLKRVNATNYLTVYVDDDGANSRLRIDKVVAGVTTNLSSTNLAARVVNGTRFWVRGRIEGNAVASEYFLSTVVPTPKVAPSSSASAVLDASTAAAFGSAVEGRVGLVFTPQQTAAFLDDFESLPFTYRTPPMFALRAAGAIPGDAPALASARMTAPSSVSSASWGMLAWAPATAVENLLRQGGFEGIGASQAPWTAAAVAGVVGAGTSVAVVTDGTLGAGAKFGEAVGQVVAPATANTGGNHPIYRLFRASQVYTAVLYVRASAGTTTVRIRLGVSGDIASSTAVALSTAWTKHTATWTPAASVELAYLAVEVTAATATTFQIDGGAVFAGATEPTGEQLEGRGAPSPLAALPAENYECSVNLVRTVDATANGGFAMRDSSVLAGGELFSVKIPVDISLMAPNDYGQGEVSIEVWARVLLSAAFTGGVTANVLASFDGGFGVYTSEFGEPGKRLTAVTGNLKWRFVRLGTLTLQPARWDLLVTFTVAAGTNLQVFGIDDVYVVPARSRFLSPTGKESTAAYPTFQSIGIEFRTVYPDLSSTVSRTYGTSQAGGIGGALLEIDPGLFTVLGVVTEMIPDSTTVSSFSDTQAFPSLHIAVTPRWHWLRDV